MPTATDFPARGKVIAIHDDGVVFRPENTMYGLHLKCDSPYHGPMNQPIEALIHVKARKVWTVISGGLWVAPITGRPRTIQGRVIHIEANRLVVHAGTPYIIDLPPEENAFSLLTGPVALNQMVNVVAFAGATFELLVPAKA